MTPVCVQIEEASMLSIYGNKLVLSTLRGDMNRVMSGILTSWPFHVQLILHYLLNCKYAVIFIFLIILNITDVRIELRVKSKVFYEVLKH